MFYMLRLAMLGMVVQGGHLGGWLGLGLGLGLGG